MNRASLFLLVIVGCGLLVGCNTGEVSANDVKSYQNAGRDADDPVVDPNTGKPVENK